MTGRIARDELVARVEALAEQARTGYERGFEAGQQSERAKLSEAIDAASRERGATETLDSEPVSDGEAQTCEAGLTRMLTQKVPAELAAEAAVWQRALDWLKTKEKNGATVADAIAAGFHKSTLSNLVVAGRAQSEGTRPRRYIALEQPEPHPDA